MKLEARSKEFYRSAFQSKPQNECLLQNQVYMFECILEILDRLDWRGSAKEADPTKLESHKPETDKEAEILDRYHKSVESETVVKMDRTDRALATPTGELDFKKQAKEISERARQNIEEEPL